MWEGEVELLVCTCLAPLPTPPYVCSPTQDQLERHPSGFSWRLCYIEHDWVNGPSVIELYLQPLFPNWKLGEWGVGGASRTETQPFNAVIGPLASLGLSQSHLINMNSGMVEKALVWLTKDTFMAHHFGHSRGFRSSAKNKDQIYIIINHSFTCIIVKSIVLVIFTLERWSNWTSPSFFSPPTREPWRMGQLCW